MEEQKLHQKLYPFAANKEEYIICAAIHYNDGKKYLHQPTNINEGFVVCGRRHHNCFMTAAIINGGKITKHLTEGNGREIQGFLTIKDRFVDRKEAGVIAFKQNQIDDETNCLFSEELY